MSNAKQEVFYIVLVSVFFILLISIIIRTAVLYHTRKKNHKIDLSNFQNILIQTQFEVQEQTMQTIGADLHDNIGQLLSLTSLTLNSIELDNHDRARHKIDVAIELTVQSIKEMRMLGKLLQGDQLIIHGLPEAIKHEVNWMERSGKYQINCSITDEMPASSNPDKDLIIFRILQEILNNIIKHSQASHIDINLEYQHEGALQLHVADDGIGFDLATMTLAERGMGLQNIEKRAGIIGGQVVMKSSLGGGTHITIIIPYP